MARTLINVPPTAKRGEVVEIKTLISHPMESGQRKDKDGNIIPRQIINHFTATFNGTPVVEVKMEPAISTNPYFEFDVKVPESGEFVFTWTDDDGSVYEDRQSIEVS